MARFTSSRVRSWAAWGVAVGVALGGAWAQAGGQGAAIPAVLLAAVAIGVWAGSPPPPAAGPSRWWVAALLFGLAGALWTEGVGTPALREVTGRVGRWVVLLGAYAAGRAAALLAGPEDDAFDEGEASGSLGLAAALAGLAIGWIAGAWVATAAPWGAGAVLWSAGAILGFAAHGVAEARARWRVLWEGDSPYHHIVVEEGRAQPGEPVERRLVLDGGTQSSEYIGSGEPALPYVRALERALAADLPPRPRVLFLGGGAGTLARRLVERDAGAEALVVEIDPTVIDLAQRFFDLRPGGSLRVLQADARAALAALQDAGGAFDAVVLDVYGGGSDRLPFGLVTVEAFTAIRALLIPTGSLLLNAIAETTGSGALRLWALVRTLAEVFPRIDLYPHHGPATADAQNVVVVARLDPDAPVRETLAGFRLWPRQAWAAAAQRAPVLRDVGSPLPAVAG